MSSKALAVAIGAASGAALTWLALRRKSHIRHIVLVKLKPETPDEAIAEILEKLAELPAKIPTILRMEIGRQRAAVDDGRNVTLGGVVEFATDADYVAYAKDEAHLGVIREYILPHIAAGGRTALQYAP